MADSFFLTEDVIYKSVDGIDLRLDYGFDKAAEPANGKGIRPIVVWIHGGAWLLGDRGGEGNRLLMKQLAANGFLMCSISYRLSTVATFPAQLQDAWDAVRWLRENAAAMGADANAVGAWGHSAGGHLAALLGLTADDSTLGGDGIPLKAVMPLSTPADLGNMPGADNPESPECLLVGSTVREAPGKMDAASPLWYVRRCPPDRRAAFLIVHSRQDEIIPFDQALSLHNAIPESSMLSIGTGSHDIDSGDVGWPEVISIAVAYFKTHLV